MQKRTPRRVLLEHRTTRRAKDLQAEPATRPQSSPTASECWYTVQSKHAECCRRLTENLGRRKKSRSSRVEWACDEEGEREGEASLKFVEIISRSGLVLIG